MRRAHFEQLRPVCPVCREAGRVPAPLALAHIGREEDGHVIEAVAHCTNPGCRSEFPIIDGVPIIVPRVRQLVSDQLLSLYGRGDLDATTESLIGDCCGPASTFDTIRQHLSTYGWSHFADLDPAERANAKSATGGFTTLLETARAMLGASTGPTIDIGCSVGRAAFELAAGTDGLVLGVDLNLAMLRLAARALREGVVRYPRRRVGVVYDRREFPVEFPGAERVDFWACDALALPFADAPFGAALSMNLLDCVASPRDLLGSLGRLLRPGGTAVVACPYDWSPQAAAPEAWLGGHSQRSPEAGSSEALLRQLLTPGGHPQSVDSLEIVDERDDLPWRVRLHDRSAVDYRVHMVAARRR